MARQGVRLVLYRSEAVGSVDGEERDLVDLRAEESDLGVGGRGEREPPVAGGELDGGVDEEGGSGRERDREAEPVGFLDRRVRARRVDWVRVAARLRQERQQGQRQGRDRES